jgi:hypothetical protein
MTELQQSSDWLHTKQLELNRSSLVADHIENTASNSAFIVAQA